MAALPPLPPHAPDVPWPTRDWPEAPPDDAVDGARLDSALAALFQQPTSEALGKTLALLAVHRGRLVVERYSASKGPGDTFHSWSMAKSVLHALVGILVGEGRLDPVAAADVPPWGSAGDPRAAITLEHLLRMVDGLEFVEFDPESGRSDVVDMLRGAGREDVAAYAESRPAARPPGSGWSYSSGTSIVICALLARVLGGGREATERFMRTRLLDPIGMGSAVPRFDPSGTWLGSSYLFATPRDFARFGLLYLRDGIWEGRRILPAGWVDHGRTPTPESWGAYGAHWWLARDGSGTFSANGFDGQHIVVVPRRDLVVVRLGISTPVQRVRLLPALKDVVESFPPVP